MEEMNRRDAIKAAIGGAAACVLPATKAVRAQSFDEWVVDDYNRRCHPMRNVETIRGCDRHGKRTVWARWKHDGRWHWVIAAQEC